MQRENDEGVGQIESVRLAHFLAPSPRSKSSMPPASETDNLADVESTLHPAPPAPASPAEILAAPPVVAGPARPFYERPVLRRSSMPPRTARAQSYWPSSFDDDDDEQRDARVQAETAAYSADVVDDEAAASDEPAASDEVRLARSDEDELDARSDGEHYPIETDSDLDREVALVAALETPAASIDSEAQSEALDTSPAATDPKASSDDEADDARAIGLGKKNQSRVSGRVLAAAAVLLALVALVAVGRRARRAPVAIVPANTNALSLTPVPDAPPEPLPAAAPLSEPTLDEGKASEFRRIARRLLQNGQATPGVLMARLSIAANPDHPESYVLLAAGLQDLGRWGESHDVFTRCVKEANGTPKGECIYFAGRGR